MQRGIEINMFDLFRHILKKWAVMLIFALVFGIIANFYGAHKASSAADQEREALEAYASELNTTIDELPEHMTAELADLRGKLSEEEASFVEAVAKLYMYRMWASDKINEELIVGEPDQGDLEIVQTLYYANEGVQSAIQVMTSAEKSYYNVLVKEQSGIDMSATEKEISVPGMLQPKWLMIGAVLGLFLGAFVVAMAYMLSGKLRTAEDMEIGYGVPVLAVSRKKETTESGVLAKGIAKLMKEQELASIAVFACETPAAKKMKEELTKHLEAQNLHVNASTGAKDCFIGEIADTDTVLFVEQIGKSRYSDIEYRVSACRKFCVKVAGCIAIEE